MSLRGALQVTDWDLKKTAPRLGRANLFCLQQGHSIGQLEQKRKEQHCRLPMESLTRQLKISCSRKEDGDHLLCDYCTVLSRMPNCCRLIEPSIQLETFHEAISKQNGSVRGSKLHSKLRQECPWFKTALQTKALQSLEDLDLIKCQAEDLVLKWCKSECVIW